MNRFVKSATFRSNSVFFSLWRSATFFSNSDMGSAGAAFLVVFLAFFFSFIFLSALSAIGLTFFAFLYGLSARSSCFAALFFARLSVILIPYFFNLCADSLPCYLLNRSSIMSVLSDA